MFLKAVKRCDWVPLNDELYIEYHDREWAVPVHDDQRLLEFLILEGVQAGLSWRTVLYKRENYRKAFDQFDPHKISYYGDPKIKSLLGDPGIIRNRLKINAAVKNSKAFLRVADEYGNFDKYIWKFVDYTTVDNGWATVSEIPARSEISDRMSKDLKKRGFAFVGSTICYSFMQAVGMLNDHILGCFRHDEVLEV